MEKQYYISKGNNLGQNQFRSKDDDLSNFTYQGTIQNIYNDPDVVWEALRTVNHYAILQQSQEFKEWERTEEAENASRTVYLQKVLSCMPKEVLDTIEAYKIKKSEQYSSILTKIENMYKNSLNSKNVSPIEFDENTALFNDRKILLHNIPMPTSLEDVEGRKDLGFLASEWFSKLEHRHEDRFCASFFKSKGLEPKEDEKDKSPHLTFIFDAESEDLKPLLRLDLFQYCRNKENNNIEKYKAEEIEILEGLLQWSPGAQSISKSKPTWSAIPGGVSSNYVIGVIANNIQENSNEMNIAIKVAEKFNVPLLRPDLTDIVGNNLSL